VTAPKVTPGPAMPPTSSGDDAASLDAIEKQIQDLQKQLQAQKEKAKLQKQIEDLQTQLNGLNTGSGSNSMPAGEVGGHSHGAATPIPEPVAEVIPELAAEVVPQAEIAPISNNSDPGADNVIENGLVGGGLGGKGRTSNMRRSGKTGDSGSLFWK
jgi:hypothetical protein